MLEEVFRLFPAQVNAALPTARKQVNAWADAPALMPSADFRKRFAAADFGYFVALVHPEVDAEALALAADWFAWLFLVDEELGGGGADLDEAGGLAAQACSVLRGAGPGGDGPAADAPLITALTELWRRTAPRGSAAWRTRFIGHLEECLYSAAYWKGGNRLRGIVPDRDTYIDRRRHTGASYVCLDLVEVLGGFEASARRCRESVFSEALNATCDVVCWTNDVFALADGRSLGEIHNLAYVVGYHDKIDEAEAISRVCADIDARIRQFLDLEANLLGRTAPDQADVTTYLGSMRTWMRGNFDWSSRIRTFAS